ncbi:glycosyltransferase family 4 protein [Beggiatoa leptomitoformis]|uniref:Glycosyltransferase n=1 Tax=Beggiatoa leptomitoformis TaxID=288004 RepID=A0A2N9YGB7_9GAMM|nr:glycosyltransferase family 1 protein [Beggiatoa leptomitoformis]ALG68256.1 glycosyltransferase [Beggiatoa leptomitoformis]AUI69435.1 glycosyltransferase [Beggiatoa leptomitoformis]
MKILIVSDAWLPQINGVVRTLLTTKQILESMGHQVLMVTPDLFKTIPCPTYPEIRLALRPTPRVAELIRVFDPDTIHIATEGPLGLSARSFCYKQQKRFTTSFHTKFPEYVNARFGIPIRWSYHLLRWFHGLSSRVMVATQSLRQELEVQGFKNLAFWSRGVDIELFRPQAKRFLLDARPISLYVGRVAVEKNIEAFLKLNLAGTKYVVGQGPQLESLKQQYPTVRFVGAKTGEELSRYYAAADVFVFPSRTDTFGLVLLESLASGTPVAAYPVSGPLDVIGKSGAGCLDENLETAVQQALTIPAEHCRHHAEQYSWQTCTQQFLSNLCPIEK